METIATYLTIDGHRFDKMDDALAHEAAYLKAVHIEEQLGKVPNDCGFANGGGFIQHSEQTYHKVKNEALTLICQIHPSIKDAIKETPFEAIHPGSIVGRMLDDYNSPVNRLWYRLYCIDAVFREWAQPYYALNPEKGEQKRLAP